MVLKFKSSFSLPPCPILGIYKNHNAHARSRWKTGPLYGRNEPLNAEGYPSQINGHLRAFNPVATLLILTTLLSEFCIWLLAVLLRLGIIILTVLLRLLAMLLLRDYLFDGLATAAGGVTTPLPRDHLFESIATATGDVTKKGLSFRQCSYGYW